MFLCNCQEKRRTLPGPIHGPASNRIPLRGRVGEAEVRAEDVLEGSEQPKECGMGSLNLRLLLLRASPVQRSKEHLGHYPVNTMH